MGSNHHTADLNLLTDVCNHEGCIRMQNSDLHPEKHTPKKKKIESNQINTDSSYSLHCNSDSEFGKKVLVILQN